MKFIHHLLLLAALLSMNSCDSPASVESSTSDSMDMGREYYQLKTYLIDNEQQEATMDKYLGEALLPALHRLDIKDVGVFKPYLSETDTINRIVILIPFASWNQFLQLDDNLNADAAYKTVGSDYLNAPFDQPPYARVESVLLRAFEDMPMMATPELEGLRSERIYEMRSYESATEAIYWNKVDMFNAGGEVKLFDRLQFNAVFYGEVVSGPKMPNLMYMTTFSDQTSRDEHWDAFRESPEWVALKEMEKYKNNVSHADLIFLYPTEYSDY